MSAQYPWKEGDQLDATPLDAAFATAYSQLVNQQSQITALQAAVAALGGGGGVISPGIGVSMTADWAGGAAVNDGDYTLMGSAPYAFTLSSIDCNVGIASGAFFATVQIDGVNVPGLTNVLVNLPVKVRTLATGNTLVNIGSQVDLIISGTVGSPTNAFVCINSLANPIPVMIPAIMTSRGQANCAFLGIAVTNPNSPFIMNDPLFGVLDVNPLQ